MNTNAQVLKHNEIVEVVFNNFDPIPSIPTATTSKSSSAQSLMGAYTVVNLRTHLRLLYAEIQQRPILWTTRCSDSERTIQITSSNFRYIILSLTNFARVCAFHCHIEWHLEEGFFATFVEAPLQLQSQSVPADQLQVCFDQHLPTQGRGIRGIIRIWRVLILLRPRPMKQGKTYCSWTSVHSFENYANIAFFTEPLSLRRSGESLFWRCRSDIAREYGAK